MARTYRHLDPDQRCQAERTPLTNDAVSETTFRLPFVVATVRYPP